MIKSIKKQLILSLMVVLCALVLAGCSDDPKNFTSGDLTVTLTQGFKEGKLNEFDAYYSSSTVSFTAKKETFDSLERAGYEINSLNDYALEIAESNQVSRDKLLQRGNYIYFTSEGSNGGAKYTYVHCLFKGGTAYWICEFVCKSTDYAKLKDRILGWADTIVIQ